MRARARYFLKDIAGPMMVLLKGNKCIIFFFIKYLKTTVVSLLADMTRSLFSLNLSAIMSWHCKIYTMFHCA